MFNTVNDLTLPLQYSGLQFQLETAMIQNAGDGVGVGVAPNCAFSNLNLSGERSTFILTTFCCELD